MSDLVFHVDPRRTVKVRVACDPRLAYHEWVHVPGYLQRRGRPTSVLLDALGRRGGMRRWSILVCNNPICHGELLIADQAITALATAALECP